MTEFADVGAHCYYDLCGQHSFLPFTCGNCKHTFCEHHRNPDDHNCSNKSQIQKPKPKKVKKKKQFKCRVKECKKKSLILIKCSRCNYNYCANHRHCDLHNCDDLKTNISSVNDNNNNNNNNNNVDEITDNRWMYVKSALCKNWNKEIVNKLETEICSQEYDFDDVIDDIEEYSIDDNNSGLMEYIIDEYNWDTKMAQKFHINIQDALKNAPQLNIGNDDSDFDSDDDIYSDGIQQTNNNSQNKPNNIQNVHSNNGNIQNSQINANINTNKKNIIQWIYNELSKIITQNQLTNYTNNTINIIMSNEIDDQMQYQLWELLGGYSAPMDFIKSIRKNRKMIQDEVKKLTQSK